MKSPSSQNNSTSQQHKLIDDIQAIVISSTLVGLGVFFFKQSGLLTGGTAGLALLISKITSFSFGSLFFMFNLPFYYFAFKRMGSLFTIKTFVAVFLVSLIADNTGRVLVLREIHPLYGALAGGFLIGVGMLLLFRHKASLGGFNIMALFLQDQYKISAGKTLVMLDISILIASFFVVKPWLLAISILGALAINLIITMNHKPGRYNGFS